MDAPNLSSEKPLRMTEEEYLAYEETSDTKHEYGKGRVYAITGGSVRHAVITVNISTALNIQLEDKDCTVSSPDTRIKVEATKSYRYADVTIFCGDPEYINERTDLLGNPVVLVEVLSPTTALTDRNEKLEEYIKIDTLQEYVLVSQHEAKVEVFSRHPSGKWFYTLVTGFDEEIKLSSIDCNLNLRRIYRKVTLDVEPSDDRDE